MGVAVVASQADVVIRESTVTGIELGQDSAYISFTMDLGGTPGGININDQDTSDGRAEGDGDIIHGL